MTDQTTLFFTSEATIAKPGSATFTFEEGYGTIPIGTNSQFTDNVGPNTFIITSSDLGYRTSAVIDGDPTVYAPVITEAFALDRRMTLDPSATSMSAAWGSLTLNNADGEFDSLVSQWVCDSLPINIKYGYKTLENFSGLRSNRTTNGTYFDSTQTLQTAPAFQTRQDYSTLYGNPGTTNQVRNPNCTGGTNGIIGGAGHQPTNWGASGLGGVVVTLVGNGTDTGITYAEFSFVGTPSASGQYAFFFDNPVPANPGDLWTASYYAKLQSGSMANVVGGQFFVQINTQSQFISTGITPTATITRVWTNVIAASDTVSAQSYFTFSVTSGAAISFNVRIGQPSLQSGVGTPLILNEPAATNSVRNPRAEGSVNGTPGTMPTNWSITNAGGITSPVLGVVGTGTESGIPYIDLSFAGVLTAGGTGYIVNFEPVGIVATLTGQVWRASLYYRLMSGTLPTGSVQIQATELTSGGANVTTQGVTITNPNSLGLAAQRRSATLTLAGGATTAFMRPNLKFTFGANLGVAFSFTIRIGGVQYERGSTTTSLILPAIGTPAATTRTVDNNYSSRGLFLDPAYGTLTTMIKGLQAPWFLNESSLIVNIRDATYWLSRPVQQSQYLGTSGYNGTASLLGVPLPKTRGGTSGNPVCNVTPTLIDPVNQIYQYSDAAGTVVNLYEGAALTITRQSDVADLYVGTTTAGMFRTSNARGMFQLGSAPVGTITLDCTGQFPSAGVQTAIMQIIHYTLTEDLLLPAANISAAHYTAMTSAYGYSGGIFFGSSDSPDGIGAISRLLIGLGGKLYPARDGTLKVLMLRDPTTMLGAGVVSTTFSQSNTISVIPQQLPSTLDPPPYRMRVNYSHNYTTQTTGLLGAATAAHKQFVSIPDQFAAAASSTVLANYSRPNDPPALIGALVIQSEALAVATSLMALWGVRRRVLSVVVPVSVGLLRDIGDIVTVKWQMDDLYNGKTGIIIGEQFRSADATITFTILI